MIAAGEKTFLEFFAGIGLVHAGLGKGKWVCTYANDIDPKKEEMYLARFPDADYFHLGDIWNKEEILKKIETRPLLATASFPCTDLSTAGYYQGLKGKHSSAFFAFHDILSQLRDEGQLPPLVMIENVPGLLTSHRGEDFRTAAQRLGDLGYFLDAFIIDARHFRPQSRPRLFIVGTTDVQSTEGLLRASRFSTLFGDALSPKGSDPLRPDRLISAREHTQLPTGWLCFGTAPLPEVHRELSAVLDTDESQPWWPEEQVCAHLDMLSHLHRERTRALRETGEEWVGTIFRRVRKGRMRAEVRFDGLAGCLRTPKGGSARQIVIAIKAEKTRMRWMTPREYARLQGADDFPINVPASQALFGFGDAVCVPVIEWIDQQILSPLATRIQTDGRRIPAREAI